MRRAWWGPACDEDQQAVLELVDDLAANRLNRTGDNRPDDVAEARVMLAEHGLWTLGADEAGGGGGADLPTAMMALARLGGTWPALAWASVQAHAAALMLGEGTGTHAALLAEIHRGSPVAVCRVGSTQQQSPVLADGRLTCTVDRIDAAAPDPRLVLLLDHDTAVVVPRDAVQFSPLLPRTGLDGALTVACRVNADVAEHEVLRGEPVRRAGAMLDVGAAALAAGVAEAAAQAALIYSTARVQFGGPLTELPTVRASLAAQASAARALLSTLAGARLDQPDVAAGAVVWAVDTALEVAAAAVQSHGGYGYMAEYGVEGLLRDLVSLRAASHATDRARVASRTLVEVGA